MPIETSTLPRMENAKTESVAGARSGIGISGAPAFGTAPLDIDRSIMAARSRQAGRLNAASITSSEFNDLLKERELLLDKKFSDTLSQSDSNRLAYVNWSLDRI